MEKYIAYAFLLALVAAFIKWLFESKKKPLPVEKKKLALSDFNPASQEDKNQLYIEWCRRKTKSVKTRRTEAQLNEYVTDFKLPTFEDWKEIHGFKRHGEWVERKVYTEWLKFIGAYVSKFDPDSPDWDGR